MANALSSTQPLTLFISSRCKDKVLYEGKQQPMSVLRLAMKQRLEEIQLGGQQVFSVWIHEDESNTDALLGNWEVCLRNARKADVFIVLYNGRAGWTGANNPVRDGVGICHAELTEAYNKSPAKVRSIQFAPLVSAKPDSSDAKFQQFFSKLGIPGAQVINGEGALDRADELAGAIVLSLAHAGVGVNTAKAYYAGEALAWGRKTFADRRGTMVQTVVSLLRSVSTATSHPAPTVAAVEIEDLFIGFVCDAIPAAMTIPAARELVGQPFLRDHELTEGWDPDICGPVHVIACQKSVTEAQALRQLGFPDALVVSHPFGVYVADEVQKIQMAFIANCRDETTTQERVETFLRWLNTHGEAKFLVQRARHRRQISDFVRSVDAIEAASTAGAAKKAAPSRRRK